MESFSEFLIKHIANSPHWKGIVHSLDYSALHFTLFGIRFQVTQDFIMVSLATLLALALLIPASRRRHADTLPKGRFAHAIEATVLYLRNDVVVPFVGEEQYKRWMPCALTLFFFILTMNLIGLIPYMHSATGNISVTAPLAVLVFLLINISGILHNGALRYLRGLAPSGLPLPLLLVMYPIEIISLVSKSATLAIRLFANMTAGHFLIFSLLGLMALMHTFAWGVFSIPLAVFMYAFEIFVAFLQAYVFTLLSMLFIGSAIHQEH